MDKLEYNLETNSPLFLYGKSEPEIRSKAFKSAMRFWWRALNANLTTKELYIEECILFGGTSTKGVIYKVLLYSKNVIKPYLAKPVPHRNNTKQAFPSNEEIDLEIHILPHETYNKDYINKLIHFTILVGGIGLRSRRGMGAFKVNDGTVLKNCIVEKIKSILTTISTLKYIHFKIDDGEYELFEIDKDFYNNNQNKYPLIKKIYISLFAFDDLLGYISKLTSDHHSKAGYAEAMGNFNPRFASPVYVSLYDIDRPIVTILNTDFNSSRFSLNNLKKIQTDFAIDVVKS